MLFVIHVQKKNKLNYKFAYTKIRTNVKFEKKKFSNVTMYNILSTARLFKPNKVIKILI